MCKECLGTQVLHWMTLWKISMSINRSKTLVIVLSNWVGLTGYYKVVLCWDPTVNLWVIVYSLLGAWDNTAEHIVRRCMLPLPEECIQMNAWQAEPAGPLHQAWRCIPERKEVNLSRTVSQRTEKHWFCVSESLLPHQATTTQPWMDELNQNFITFTEFLESSPLGHVRWSFGSKLILFFLSICFLFFFRFYLIRVLDNGVFYHQGISWPVFVESWGALCPSL